MLLFLPEKNLRNFPSTYLKERLDFFCCFVRLQYFPLDSLKWYSRFPPPSPSFYCKRTFTPPQSPFTAPHTLLWDMYRTTFQCEQLRNEILCTCRCQNTFVILPPSPGQCAEQTISSPPPPPKKSTFVAVLHTMTIKKKKPLNRTSSGLCFAFASFYCSTRKKCLDFPFLYPLSKCLKFLTADIISRTKVVSLTSAASNFF